MLKCNAQIVDKNKGDLGNKERGSFKEERGWYHQDIHQQRYSITYLSFSEAAASAQSLRVLTCKIACGLRLTRSSMSTNT